MFVSILYMFVVIQFWNGVDGDCIISMKDDIDKELEILLIRQSPDKLEFAVPPLNSDKISVSENNAIQIYCPRNVITIDDEEATTALADLKCRKNSFYLNESPVSFGSIGCCERTGSRITYTGVICLENAAEVEVGFNHPHSFLTVFKGCFDERRFTTLYTTHTISYAIASPQSGHARKCWTNGEVRTSYKLKQIYNRNNQRVTINKQLGLLESSMEYVTNAEYFVRGHLTPKADFIYASQQDATFKNLNAVPQWRSINNGNWKRLEKKLRDTASLKGKDLKIYTGTWQTLIYPHKKTNRATQLYLFIDGQKEAIPVPKYIWKIAYHAPSKEGIAYICVNDRFKQKKIKDVEICDNICPDDFKSKSGDIEWEKGYIYCCKVDEFRKAVSTIPAEIPKNLNPDGFVDRNSSNDNLTQTTGKRVSNSNLPNQPTPKSRRKS